MRKKFGKLAVCMLALMLGCGCGKNKNESEEKNTEETVKTEADDTQEAETQDTEVEVSEEKKSEELEIDLPNEEELVADYTSMKGLILEEGSRIAFVVKNTETGYWKAVKKGIDQAINDLNTTLGYEGDAKIQYTFEGPKEETGVDQQVNILDAVVSEHPDVLCLAAIDMDSCVAQLEYAEENGIPVVVLDSGINHDELIYSVCATDNYAAGQLAAQKMSELIGGEGEIAVMSHHQLGETSKNRVDGFVDEITENHPDITIVDISYEPVNDEEPTIQEKITTVLETYPNLKGYFGTNEVMSVGILDTLKAQKYENLTVVGFDLGATQAEAIRSGLEAGSVCQNPYGMGYATTVAAVRAILDMENDSFIDSGYQWIDQTTIDLEENAKYLYE